MVKRKYSKASMRKPMIRTMKESYSDIDYSNVWDAYDVAIEYLGAEGLCEALAKAMGTDELESNLKYIFRVYDIPFGDDEEEIDEGCHGRKSKKRKSKKNEDLSDDLICRTCSNFKVEQTDTGTWVVKADSKRFGKQAIVFEGSSRREALNWMYKHIQPAKESVRKSSKKRTMKESKDNDVFVVFRKYYNEYTDTYEPIAFIYGGGMKASYGRVNIIEQDGIVPHMKNPRYVHDEADVSYINKTKPLGVDDPNYDAFSEYVLDELRSDGMNPVIRLKINQYAVRDGWKR